MASRPTSSTSVRRCHHLGCWDDHVEVRKTLGMSLTIQFKFHASGSFMTHPSHPIWSNLIHTFSCHPPAFSGPRRYPAVVGPRLARIHCGIPAAWCSKMATGHIPTPPMKNGSTTKPGQLLAALFSGVQWILNMRAISHHITQYHIIVIIQYKITWQIWYYKRQADTFSHLMCHSAIGIQSMV